jgi:beta-lactamase class A
MAGGAADLASGPSATRAPPSVEAIAELERRAGGRLGVFAIDCGSDRRLAWRADERFLMCSTFKTLAVAAVLSHVDAGRERLDRRIAYGAADLLEYAPVTRAHIGEAALSVQALCQAAIEVSDNTAANLLVASVGGPAAVTRFARSIGDTVTRMERFEPEANRPDGVKDTTTPRAMATSMQAILLGEVLTRASRERLEGWMVDATPGLKRIRAGLPVGWTAGDKAGTGDGQTNDVAILRPPGRAPLIVAAYHRTSNGDLAAREGVLCDVGRLAASWALGPAHAPARG